MDKNNAVSRITFTIQDNRIFREKADTWSTVNILGLSGSFLDSMNRAGFGNSDVRCGVARQMHQTQDK